MKENKDLSVFVKTILAIFVSFMIGGQNYIVHYSSMFLLLSGLMIYLFLSTDLNVDKKTRKYACVSAGIFSLVLSIGYFVYAKTFETANFQIFTFRDSVSMFFLALAYFVLLYFVSIKLFKAVSKIRIVHEKENDKPIWKVFVVSFIVIFVLYLPYFLRCYPALMSPDSFVQIGHVEKVVFANNHPFVQTWFFGGIYNLGKIVFGPGNRAIAFYTLVQMGILASLFSLVVAYLYKKKVSKKVCLAVLLFYVLSPLHAFFSVTLWKDIVFGSAFILVMISLLTIIENGLTIKNAVFYVLSILIMLFFRNNGIYIFLLMVPFVIFALKNFRIKIAILQVAVLGFYFVITGPVYTAIGVKSTNTVEALSIPLQQIARVIVQDKKIDDVSYEYLERLLDIDNIKNVYTPHISDPVKNSVDFELLDEDKVKFLKVWFKVLFEHPVDYVESYLSSTVGYWYPNVVYHAISSTNAANEMYNAYEYGIDNKSLVPEFMAKLIDKTADKTLPFSIVFWSSGFYCCLLAISIIAFMYKNGIKSRFIIAYLPLVALWGSIMISSPVCAELRYIYGIFTCIPLCLVLPFMNLKENKKYYEKN